MVRVPAGPAPHDGGRSEYAPFWSLPTRIAFRFVCAYFLQFALCTGHKTILEKVPAVGHSVQGAFNLPYLKISEWIAIHMLHLSGAAVVPHFSGYADRALDWITAAIMLAIAGVATLIWSGIDRRKAYPELWLWLRFLLRLTLIVPMLWYGSIKLWPIQIESPSLAVLNEPVGNMSPMTLLWTLLGSNHNYERLCGLVETVCGLLLIFRRTAFSGALLAVVIMSNVVLFDLFFDVPVRLYAFNLLVMAVVVLAPDLKSFFTLLWTRQPTALTSRWVPSATRPAARYSVLAVEFVFLLVFLKGFFNHAQYTREAAGERNPPAISGQWHLETSVAANDATPVPFYTPTHSPMTDLFLEPSGRDTIRAADQTLYGGGSYDADAKTLTLPTTLMALVSYRIEQPDPSHLILHPAAPAEPELHLARVPLPASYPLYQRSFHLFQEFSYER
jgi:hypothetical protein